MIKLRLEIKEKELLFNRDINTSFNHKVIYFSTHNNDKRRILKDFVICDLKNNKIIYLSSFLDTNLEICDKE
jgi:hypothetical protein